MTEDDNRWHLDRKVPIAIIVTIVIQTGTIVWWAASTSERLSYLERRETQTAPQADRLTRVEVQMEAIREGIARIERLMQRQESRP